MRISFQNGDLLLQPICLPPPASGPHTAPSDAFEDMDCFSTWRQEVIVSRTIAFNIFHVQAGLPVGVDGDVGHLHCRPDRFDRDQYSNTNTNILGANSFITGS